LGGAQLERGLLGRLFKNAFADPSSLIAVWKSLGHALMPAGAPAATSASVGSRGSSQGRSLIGALSRAPTCMKVRRNDTVKQNRTKDVTRKKSRSILSIGKVYKLFGEGIS